MMDHSDREFLHFLLIMSMFIGIMSIILRAAAEFDECHRTK